MTMRNPERKSESRAAELRDQRASLYNGMEMEAIGMANQIAGTRSCSCKA